VDRVSAGTRDRVLQAAHRLDYVASPTAASLATGRTGVVGVLAPFLSRWFFAHALDGVEHTLRTHGLHLLLLNVGSRPSTGPLLLDEVRLRKRVDAVLVVSCDLGALEVAMLAALRVPVATLGVDVGPWDLVGVDDAAAGDTAMTHLLSLGHRRLAYVGGDVEQDVHVATAVQRLEGVRRALRRARVDPECLQTVVGDWTVAGGLAAGGQLLDQPTPPTAVLAASDEMAIGVLMAARRRGVRVPQELSVMGVDDHELAWTHDLTTVAQPVEALGTAAAQLVVDALAAGAPVPGRPRRVVTLATSLVVRGSTGPVPA
jgi:DNA-binding LacI/PurR family transcriptional regulator